MSEIVTCDSCGLNYGDCVCRDVPPVSDETRVTVEPFNPKEFDTGCRDKKRLAKRNRERARIRAEAERRVKATGLEDGPGSWGTEVYCGRCGGSTEFVPCPDCDGGWSGHDCGEDCCACLDPDPNVLCQTCGGKGGFRHCTNKPEWCEANPLPGREPVPSTALSNQTWRDVL